MLPHFGPDRVSLHAPAPCGSLDLSLWLDRPGSALFFLILLLVPVIDHVKIFTQVIPVLPTDLATVFGVTVESGTSSALSLLAFLFVVAPPGARALIGRIPLIMGPQISAVSSAHRSV